MDLSKTFDTINHDLATAKLKVYGFSGEALKFMQNYLKNRKQRVLINNKFSFERDVIAEVPQGCIVAGADPEIWKRGGALYVGHHIWPAKNVLGFRWFKNAEITLKFLAKYFY